MKKSIKFLLALTISASMLLSFAAAAEEATADSVISSAPDADGEVVVTAEPIRAHYHNHELDSFSDAPAEDDWKYRPLNCAVNNGSMNGHNGKIRPDDDLTRAEMAAMIVRFLDASGITADISKYIDLTDHDWFYGYISSSVAIEILKGNGNKMSPNSPITREETFAVLARTFLITPQTQNASNKFDDTSSVSDWARYSTNALIDAKVVLGDTRNTIRPKSNVSRAELAAMLDRIVCLKLTRNSFKKGDVIEGNVIITDPSIDLTGVTILGNVYISDAVGNNAIDLTGASISGNVVVRGGEVSVAPDKKENVITREDYKEPEITKPDDTKPDDTKPDDTKPDDTKPDDTKPDGTKTPGSSSLPSTSGTSVELVDGGTYITRRDSTPSERLYANIYNEGGYQVVEFDFRGEVDSEEYENLFVKTRSGISKLCVQELTSFRSDVEYPLADVIEGILNTSENANDDMLVPIAGRALTHEQLIDRMEWANAMFTGGFESAFDLYKIDVASDAYSIIATFEGKIDNKTFFLRLITGRSLS